jgi:uncharacterized protein YbaP (TraB family)
MNPLRPTATITIKLLLLAVLFFRLPVSAQQNSENALLWKVEGNGLKKVSYLFGTVHMICEEAFAMPEKVLSAMDQTEQSFLEINMAAPDFGQQAQKYMKSEKSLSSEVSKEEYAYIDSVVSAKLNYKLSDLENLKPAIIMAFLLQKSFTCKVLSFEEEIIKRTKTAGKGIDGLSSVAEQYSFLDKIFEAKDMGDYLRTYTDLEMNKITKVIMDAYIKEDLSTIDKVMLEFSSTNPEGYNQLLPVRNQLWVARMPAIMETKATFFSVGCGHLSGNEGLVNLLRLKGYQVTPVN